MSDLSIFACVAAREMFRQKPDATSMRGDEFPHKNCFTIGDHLYHLARINEWNRDTNFLSSVLTSKMM